MTDASRDVNSVTTLMAVSSSDGVTPVLLWADPITHRLLTSSGGGAASLTVGSTTISGGTNTSIEYNNNGILGEYAVVGSGSVLLVSGTPTSTPTASTIAEWDANVNMSANNLIDGFTTTATAAGTTTMVVTNTSIQVWTGATTQTIKLPTTGVVAGMQYTFINLSTGAITIQSSGANTIVVVAAGTAAVLTALVATPTTAANWNSNYAGIKIASGKALTVSNSLTLAGTDGTTMTFPGTSDTVVTLAATQTLTNKTLTSPTLTTPAINGTATGTGVSSTPTASILAMWDANVNFSANNLIDGFATTATAAGTTALTVTSKAIQVFTGSTTQTVTLPTTGIVAGQQYVIINQSTGAVTVQSSGANTITVLAAGTSATFTAVVATPTTAANWNSQYFGGITASGKVLTANNTLTLAGTDSTTMTFPSTSASVARIDAAQTFTGIQTFAQIVTTVNAITATSNAATVPITSRISNVTNSSAAAMTITLTTSSAVDGMMLIVRIFDFSAVAESITWVNTENSTVNAPTTSNGSTTLPLTVGFMYNAATSKWRCIASA